MSKIKWRCNTVIKEYNRVSEIEFQQLLAEISKIFYRPKLRAQNDCPKSTGSSHVDGENAYQERTGTDGI